MRFFSSLLAIVLVCLLAVEGRNFYKQDTESDKNENLDKTFLRNRPERHQRNRRQSYYRHYNDYVNSFQNFGIGDFLKDILSSVREIETHVKQGAFNRNYPSYYDNRHDYPNKCEDSVQELLVLYKALALQLKYTTPPPPQIIYIPYPVLPTWNQSMFKTPTGVNITNRDRPEDTNRIWMDIPKEVDTEDDGDGSRPVIFEKKPPKKPNVTSPPQMPPQIQTTTPPTFRTPGICESAILSCCGMKTDQERENCFDLFKCSQSYKTGVACSPKAIEKVLSVFKSLYGPTDEI